MADNIGLFGLLPAIFQFDLMKRVLPCKKIANLIHYVLLIILIFLTFFVVLIMISMSLRPTTMIYVHFWGLPLPPTFENYRIVTIKLLPAMGRSLFVTVISILGILSIACPAAYGFARLQAPGKELLFYIVLGLMMIPGAITLAPSFILFERLHLRGSLWGLIVSYIAGAQPFAIFLLTTFFRSQSEEIFEAARIDGASELQALIRVAVPLAVPILTTVAIMNFLSIYDDYIWPGLMLGRKNETLMLALARFDPQTDRFLNRPDVGGQTAGYVFATLPQLLLFSLAMKYYIQGLTSGSVKA
ncbi:MAG: carbohydrate ABC transporter permease [Desulfomonilaceae bacterium]